MSKNHQLIIFEKFLSQTQPQPNYIWYSPIWHWNHQDSSQSRTLHKAINPLTFPCHSSKKLFLLSLLQKAFPFVDLCFLHYCRLRTEHGAGEVLSTLMTTYYISNSLLSPIKFSFAFLGGKWQNLWLRSWQFILSALLLLSSHVESVRIFL